MHALAADAPPAPSDAELADPVRMGTYMEALSAHASRQQEAIRNPGPSPGPTPKSRP